jgi:hypothetical protein
MRLTFLYGKLIFLEVYIGHCVTLSGERDGTATPACGHPSRGGELEQEQWNIHRMGRQMIMIR